MNTFFTLKRIIFFLGIVFLGIIGLIVADQIRFEKGDTEQVIIGNGVADPLAESVREDLSATIGNVRSFVEIAPSKIIPITNVSSPEIKNPNIDGVRARK